LVTSSDEETVIVSGIVTSSVSGTENTIDADVRTGQTDEEVGEDIDEKEDEVDEGKADGKDALDVPVVVVGGGGVHALLALFESKATTDRFPSAL
jgi:hypothetical protein